MIDVAVAGFVGADGDDHIAQARPGVELPVGDGDRGRRRWHRCRRRRQPGTRCNSRPLPPRSRPRRDARSGATSGTAGNMRCRKCPAPGARAAARRRWPGDLHEGHEVHALVLRLVQEQADAAAIGFEAAQGTQVPKGSADHNGHPGHATATGWFIFAGQAGCRTPTVRHRTEDAWTPHDNHPETQSPQRRDHGHAPHHD